MSAILLYMKTGSVLDIGAEATRRFMCLDALVGARGRYYFYELYLPLFVFEGRKMDARY